MSTAETIRGHAVVMQPDDGPSYWQPVPANGHADPKLFPANTRFDGLAMGYQTIVRKSRAKSGTWRAQKEPSPLSPGTSSSGGPSPCAS